MLVYYPASLYALGTEIRPSQQWMNAAGWTRGKAFPMLIPGSRTSELVPDPFIQKGKGKRNDVYHAKLPPVYTFVSQPSLKFWCNQHNLWPGLDVHVGNLFTPMYKAYDNGIHYAYCYMTFRTSSKSYIFAEAKPARGIGTDFWTIGTIYYHEYKEMDPPNWRYQINDRHYSVDVQTHFPWLGDQSYDSGKAYDAMLANFNSSWFSSWDIGSAPLYGYTEYAKPDFTSNLFREDLRISGLSVAKGQYELDWLVQHAFYDACAGIGKANDNSIQNIVEIVSDIAGICETFGMGSVELASDVSKMSLKRRLKRKYLNHDVVKVAETSSSAWLKYRYQYCTSVMDAQEYNAYLNHKVDRYFDFLNQNYHEVVFGSANRTVNGKNVHCTCQLAYRPRTFEGLKTAMRYLHDVGLMVNPYVLWDFVPYSFVVDWFAPIGDVASVISDQRYYTSEYYDFEFCGFSIKYEDEVGTRYYRWYQAPPNLDSSYWFDKGGKTASTKLKLKRTADVVSLVVG